MKEPTNHDQTVPKTSRSTAGRRDFLKSTAGLVSLPLLAESIPGISEAHGQERAPGVEAPKSIIGSYGSWADGLVQDPPSLSFRLAPWDNVDGWRRSARAKVKELIASPVIGKTPDVRLNKQYSFDGLDIEELSWQLPYGRATRAVLLKPSGANGPLPAILGLHDHGGNKYFGLRKIVRTSDQMHPLMRKHQENYYEGRAWANEIAKRGYVVLVHDAFAFASRRVLFEEMSEIPWGGSSTRGKSDTHPEARENIETYNDWAGAHEDVMAKSLFCAGTTWPGVFLAEDQCALDVLQARDDVDAKRLGCAGLSGGGLRTVYLGGMDSRINCAIAVGFMSTWRDFLMNKSYTHTWMTYAPLVPKYLDFPEILGMRVPLPTMTLNNNDDALYTLPEMKRADAILKEVFAKAGAADRYHGGFYPGNHKFDAPMQQAAFDWFDQWLNR